MVTVCKPIRKARIAEYSFRGGHAGHDTVSEWLRRWTRNPLGSARRGSNPLGVGMRSSALGRAVVFTLAQRDCH